MFLRVTTLPRLPSHRQSQAEWVAAFAALQRSLPHLSSAALHHVGERLNALLAHNLSTAPTYGARAAQLNSAIAACAGLLSHRAQLAEAGWVVAEP